MTAPQGAGVLAAVGVLVVAGMGAQHDVRLSPVIGEPDFRAAAAVVDSRYKAGDGIAYVGQLRTGRLPFEYELRTAKPKDVFVARSAAEQGLFYPAFCSDPAACLGNTGRVWLVVSNYAPDPFTGMAADQAALLRQNYTVSSTDSFHGVRVLLLVRKSTG
jgi:mannosyltransferase